MDNSKTCTKCGQIKSIESFSRHNSKKASKSGYRATCKACDVAYNREYRQKNRDAVNARKRAYDAKNKEKKAESDRRYRVANKEKIAEKNKKWRLENADYVSQKSKQYRLENKDKKAETDRAWAARNPEKIRESSKRWRKNNPEKAANVVKAYSKRNPEVKVNIRARRRARQVDNGIYKVTQSDLVKLLQKPCTYCGQKSAHIDHVIPISRGGRHSIGNLTPACRTCNLSKGSKFIMEWRKGNNEAR